MARKVFISILGTGLYGKCKYGNSETQETRFVQTATLEWIGAKNWTNEDTALIFLTTEAKKTSWEKYERRDRKTGKIIESERDKGLKECLAEMSLPFLPQGIDIEDGINDEEMWKIFITIFGQLKDEDWLYIDSTHGYRYLPMLLLVLSNYARFLKKDIEIKHISYGNFEARNGNIAPFVDLMPLINLQDWTVAAQIFIDYGKTDKIHTLLEDKYRQLNKVAAEQKSLNQDAKSLQQLDKKLIAHSESIISNKLDDIIAGSDILKSLAEVKQSETIIEHAFTPLLEKIEEKLKDFCQNDMNNVFAATEWCINHELYQNAYSILLEGTISLLLKNIGEINDENASIIETKRGIVNYIADFKANNKSDMNDCCKKNLCISAYRVSEKFDEAQKQDIKNAISKLWDVIDDKLVKIISGLNTKRNSYMHAGTGTNNSLGRFKDLKEDIVKFNRQLKNHFNHNSDQ
jgi:CRISPR-associated Csx2 family protein